MRCPTCTRNDVKPDQRIDVNLSGRGHFSLIVTSSNGDVMTHHGMFLRIVFKRSKPLTKLEQVVSGNIYEQEISRV